MRRRTMLIAALLAFCCGAPLAAPAVAADSGPALVVFAAASLKNALDAADTLYQHQGGVTVRVSYAASSALAKQIEAGAPADLFISADLAWMDYLAKRKMIRPDTRSNLLSNALVLIAPANSKTALKIAPGFPLLKALGADGRLAMADPSAVPAGKYGKAALTTLGVWSQVESRVAPAEDVRAALLLVSRAEAPLGIVYRTDAAVDPGVKIVDTFPASSLPPILYPIAITTDSKNAAAGAYLQFLKSPAARPAFVKQGFQVLE